MRQIEQLGEVVFMRGKTPTALKLPTVYCGDTVTCWYLWMNTSAVLVFHMAGNGQALPKTGI